MSKKDAVAIKKSDGIPWGEADRIVRASALLAFSYMAFPEAWEDNERFFRFAASVCRAFDLNSDTARGFAFAGAWDIIQANPRDEVAP